MRLELRDNEAANAIERQSLEQTVLEMNKELAMKWMIIDNFVPPQVVESVKARAIFDEVMKNSQWGIHKKCSHVFRMNTNGF